MQNNQHPTKGQSNVSHHWPYFVGFGMLSSFSILSHFHVGCRYGRWMRASTDLVLFSTQLGGLWITVPMVDHFCITWKTNRQAIFPNYVQLLKYKLGLHLVNFSTSRSRFAQSISFVGATASKLEFSHAWACKG